MGVMGPGERARIEEEVEERQRAGWPAEVEVEFGVHIEEAAQSLDHGVMVEAHQGGYTVHVEGMSKASAVSALRAAADHLDPPAMAPVPIVEDDSLPMGEQVGLSDPEQQTLGPFVAESETSRQAAIAAYPKQGSQRWQILDLLWAFWTMAERGELPADRLALRGQTREEIADQLGMSGDTVRPRVVELIDGGWLEESEFTRRTHAGNEAAVLMLTEKARKRLVEASSG